MQRHADRMARLVEDMLMLSRVETPGSGYLKKEDFNLSQLAREVCQRLETTAAAQHATIALEISPEEFGMQGDAFYWSQVLYNLLENALKNNPAPGLNVALKAEKQEDGTRVIRIEDNGIGIPADALPFIFNRFYRADKSGKIKGTGLGLSIVKHAVEAHGGKITVESTPGVHTCFSIVIPPSAS
jgi:two-component system phosphate regulon sensor histidine kinase PhoR